MLPAALVANGPAFAVGDALELLVLGCIDEAATLLEFVPRLRDVLADPAGTALSRMPENRQKEAAAYLREHLLVGVWLQTGNLDRQLADDAYDYFVKLIELWGGAPTDANVLHMMLLSLEAGRPDRAIRDYELHDSKADRPLTSARLAKNPRALLFAHTVRSRTPAGVELTDAVARFRASATQWEKGVEPLPYVGIVTLARVLRACAELRGDTVSVQSLLRQVA
jgi:hypothetical protein